MRALCEDVVARVAEFRHVSMRHVAVTFAQARRRVPYGLQAKLTPMRFENGSLVTYRGRTGWTVRRLFQDDHEILYILTFYLPRFQEQTFREKLVTVFHELYHISPRFDGDLRRLHGRYHVHSHSQKEYDCEMGRLVDHYLAADPPAERFEFLRHKFRALEAQYGGVVGRRMPIPKLIRLPSSKSA